ncbi:unnamed protein product [Urochloa humidicola]
MAPLAPGSKPRSGCDGGAEAASPAVLERTGAAKVPTSCASCPTQLRRRRTSRSARQWSSRGRGGFDGHAPLPLPRVRRRVAERRGVDLGRRHLRPQAGAPAEGALPSLAEPQGGNVDARAKG